jgi:hypothetical protein
MRPEMHIEELIVHARKTVWLALVFCILYGSVALLMALDPSEGEARVIRRMLILVPVFLPVLIVTMRLPGPASRAMKALLADELRQAAIQKAIRNGLLVVLMALPLMAWLFTVVQVTAPLALMACLGCLLGIGTVLGSVLYYDR